ncbi:MULTISPECIES: DUF3006 domain-containing protein [unclassified Clostridium]|uniref:DUF3006 domain-containing protein n=1 Tax=unclassified Clostridium TaxID=2614128 RepID=UPI0018983A2C|nr:MULTISPECIES: DUF3006 domain-containing protein [unclassified Clostridium]MCR1952762.1 DUF3006 domain-containing protein [Clostridium sp. DSM 100503]
MEKKEYIVDRIESDYVVLEIEYDNLINVKKSDIIGSVKEGDILIKKDNFYFIDEKATKLRRESINTMMKGLWEE